VKPIRRIATTTGENLYDEISQHVLAAAWSRAELDAVEREHPRLIVRRGANVLAATEAGDLAYAFESQRAFIDLSGMFEELPPRNPASRMPAACDSGCCTTPRGRLSSWC
jgi:hypothetical protein